MLQEAHDLPSIAGLIPVPGFYSFSYTCVSAERRFCLCMLLHSSNAIKQIFNFFLLSDCRGRSDIIGFSSISGRNKQCDRDKTEIEIETKKMNDLRTV